MASGAAGHLLLPPSTPAELVDSLRGAHLFAPVPVWLVGPVDYDPVKATFTCSALAPRQPIIDGGD